MIAEIDAAQDKAVNSGFSVGPQVTIGRNVQVVSVIDDTGHLCGQAQRRTLDPRPAVQRQRSRR